MCKAEDGMNTAFGLTIRFIAIPRSTSRFMIATCHYLFFVHKRLTLSYIFKKILRDLHRSWEALQPLWHWADPWRSCWGTSYVVILLGQVSHSLKNVWTYLMIDTFYTSWCFNYLQLISGGFKSFQVALAYFLNFCPICLFTPRWFNLSSAASSYIEPLPDTIGSAPRGCVDLLCVSCGCAIRPGLENLSNRLPPVPKLVADSAFLCKVI
jgi:hypothetical protein